MLSTAAVSEVITTTLPAPAPTTTISLPTPPLTFGLQGYQIYTQWLCVDSRLSTGSFVWSNTQVREYP